MAFTPETRKSQNYVQRLPKRALYDEESVYHAIDQCPVTHVTFKLPDESEDFPSIIPMIFARKDQIIYLHGHLSSRLLKALSEEDTKSCATFTTVNGVVVSLTPFHNSNNYESAVVYGHSRLVEDEAEKVEALTLITNNAFRTPGTDQLGDRWEDSRPTNDAEIKGTRVVALDIASASAKKRDAGPSDDQADKDTYADKYWTGVIVRESRFTKVIPSSYNPGLPLPSYIQRMLQ